MSERGREGRLGDLGNKKPYGGEFPGFFVVIVAGFVFCVFLFVCLLASYIPDLELKSQQLGNANR